MTKDRKTATIENRKAYHDYYVEEKLECGIELLGNEVKSIKDGKMSIKEAWISVENGQLIMKNSHVAKWGTANKFDVDERRDRRLLAHKTEIRHLDEVTKLQGYTLIPLKVYTVRGLCKVEIGLCKGKHNYDKRDSIKKRDMQREAGRYS